MLTADAVIVILSTRKLHSERLSVTTYPAWSGPGEWLLPEFVAWCSFCASLAPPDDPRILELQASLSTLLKTTLSSDTPALVSSKGSLGILVWFSVGMLFSGTRWSKALREESDTLERINESQGVLDKVSLDWTEWLSFSPQMSILIDLSPESVEDVCNAWLQFSVSVKYPEVAATHLLPKNDSVWCATIVLESVSSPPAARLHLRAVDWEGLDILSLARSTTSASAANMSLWISSSSSVDLFARINDN